METNKMEQDGNGFYVINVIPLKTSSRKPRHLAKRKASKSSKQQHQQHKTYSQNREAFLKTRREKLRSKNVYVEKVVEEHRRRVSGEVSQKSERITQSIKTAEENRLKLLDQQVAQAKDRVAHAKKVAETHRERMQAEKEEKRNELEKRQMRVASRRKHLLAVPRSRLLELNDWSIEELQDLQSTLNESAVIIQNWWMSSRLAPIIKTFSETKVTLRHAKSMDFDSLIPLMQKKEIIHAGYATLFYHPDIRRSSIIDLVRKLNKQKKWRNPSRVFLSAYMLASHPHESMPQFGAEEEAIQKSAENVIVDFEKLGASIHSREVRKLMVKFAETFATYYDEFEKWKAADTKKIVDSMIAHWIEMEKLWLSVRHTQTDAEENWHPKIAKQQKAIMQKISKFGMHALKRLKREQKKLVREMGVEEELRPEFADIESDSSSSSSAYESDGANFGTSPERFPLKSFMQTKDSVISRRDTGATRAAEPSSSISFEKQNPKMVPSPVANSKEVLAGPIAPAAPVETKSASFGAALSNEQLAHELVRNPDFKLKPKKKGKLEEQISKVAMKAFFDTAREQFAQGIYINFVPSLLEDIKKHLLAMVSPKGKIYAEINEHLDMDLARQQIEHGVFNVEQCTNYIISKMTQLCAPIRDQSIRDLAEIDDLATKFQKTLEILELCQLDLANYKLGQLAPMLKNMAVEYESKKFSEAVEAGNVQLDQTRAWLKKAYGDLDAVARSRNPENIVSPENKIKFEDVYNDSLIKLVFSSKALDPASVPETLTLDMHYIFQLQNEAQLVTIVAALVMLSKNAVPAMRRDQASVKKLRDNLFALLADHEDDEEEHAPVTVENLANEILRICSESLDQGAVIPEENQQLIRNMVDRTLSTSDTLFSMISRRVKGLCLGQLKTGEFRSVTGASLSSAGLDIVETELAALSKKIYMLAKHNKEVHAKYYDDLLKEIVNDSQ